MKKLLILGGGYAEIPLIRAAKKLGYYVITTGNALEGLGHKYSDQYIQADFSDKEAMLKVAKKLDVDAICPCANDFSALSCSYVAEHMGFDHYDSYKTSMIIHHKDSYRKFAEEHNILSPKAKSFTDIKSAIESMENFTLPLIIKPVDLSGGKGVSKVDNLNYKNIDNLIEKAFETSKAKRIVIEEFIEGSNHGFSTFLRNGKIIFHFCDNEHYYINKYLVSGASVPSSVSDTAINKLIQEAEKIASILKLKDGIFHIQFILKDNIPYIIEICRRPPGDLYIDFVKFSTGVNYPDYLVKSFSGLEINDLKQVNPKGYFTRHCIMSDTLGMISNILIDKRIEVNIIDSLLWWEKGDMVTDVLTQKFGIIFLKYDSLIDMNEKVDKLNNLIKVEVI